MPLKTTLLICLLLALIAAGLVWLITVTEPEAEREGAVRESAMLVSVEDAEAGDFEPTIVAMGVVRPAREITLRPRVSGEVTGVSTDFVPGGYVREGEVLARIDEADYRSALRQRESELAQARAELEIEQGRRDLAEGDYERLDQKLPEERLGLVLREPQLRSVRAQIDSAEAALEQARLNLQRTRIVAPFDAHVLGREVNRGSQVSAGDAMGRLVGLERFWVEVSLPVSRLSQLAVPAMGDEQGAPVEIRDKNAWAAGLVRDGEVFRLIGELDAQTRMARLLVAVDDPHAREAASDDVPRLMVGSFVEARIQGRVIPDVVRVRRDYIRQGDTIWLMRDDRLVINEVDVVFTDARYAYIRDGVNADDRIVTTHLATVREGARLRVSEQASEADIGEATGS